MTDSTRTVSPTKWKAPWERQLLGGFSFLVKPMESSHNPIFSICDSPQKSSAVRKVYRAGLAAEGRPVLVQPLSLTPFDSSPSRGASGETVHFAGTAKASPFGRGVTEGDGEGKPGRKEPLRSDGQALCQSDAIAVPELFVSGLALSVSSQAPRQLPQRGSHWQAG